MRTPIALAAMVLLLGACGADDDGGSASTPAPSPTTAVTTASRIADAERDGSLPPLDRSGDVAGPDADGDGVRDDIAAYIAARPYAAEQKAAMTQTARALRSTLTVNLADRGAVDAVSMAQSRAINCVYARFPHTVDPTLAAHTIDVIQEMTANTRDRVRTYLAFSDALDGAVLPNPEGDTCD